MVQFSTAKSSFTPGGTSVQSKSAVTNSATSVVLCGSDDPLTQPSAARRHTPIANTMPSECIATSLCGCSRDNHKGTEAWYWCKHDIFLTVMIYSSHISGVSFYPRLALQNWSGTSRGGRVLLGMLDQRLRPLRPLLQLRRRATALGTQHLARHHPLVRHHHMLLLWLLHCRLLRPFACRSC